MRGLSPKRFTVGAHRSYNPADFWTRIEPFLPMAGVTRVANITGLDHVGIPVYSAIRPRATTLALASGKGLTPSAAMVSAGMEAIEVFSAESAVLPEICRSRNELRRAGVSLPLDRLPLRRHALISADASIRWTLGTDLVTGA